MSELKIAAAYIRVSTDEQAELSPDSQLSVIRSYAEKNGCILPDNYIFVDEGISGRTAKKRCAKQTHHHKQQNPPSQACHILILSQFLTAGRQTMVEILY